MTHHTLTPKTSKRSQIIQPSSLRRSPMAFEKSMFWLTLGLAALVAISQ